MIFKNLTLQTSRMINYLKYRKIILKILHKQLIVTIVLGKKMHQLQKAVMIKIILNMMKFQMVPIWEATPLPILLEIFIIQSIVMLIDNKTLGIMVISMIKDLELLWEVSSLLSNKIWRALKKRKNKNKMKYSLSQKNLLVKKMKINS